MAESPSPLLADRFAPRPEFGRTDHLLVDATPAATWKSLRELDLTELRGGLAAFAVWFREVPERWLYWRTLVVARVEGWDETCRGWFETSRYGTA